jgi:hypothetical protein
VLLFQVGFRAKSGLPVEKQTKPLLLLLPVCRYDLQSVVRYAE